MIFILGLFFSKDYETLKISVNPTKYITEVWRLSHDRIFTIISSLNLNITCC